MKILIDARLYGLYHRGLGRYLMELVKGILVASETDQYVLLIDPKLESELPLLPANFTTIAAPWRAYSLAEQIMMPRLIKKIKPDLVHWPHFNAPYFCSTPFLITIHDLILHHAPSERATTLPGFLYWLKVGAYRILMRRLTRKARYIVTISQFVADDIKSHYPDTTDKIKVIPLAPTILVKAQAFKSHKPYLLTVGAAYPHKNLERLIEAVAIVRQQYPELELRLVGRSDFFVHQLIKFTQDKGYADWVIFMSQVTDQELSALYRGCQAYLLLSLQEGFGLGALEAAACGAPVVAADITVLKEILGSGALFADPTSEFAMAKQISKMMNAQIRQRMIIASSQTAHKYSWPQTITNTLKAYQDCV